MSKRKVAGKRLFVLDTNVLMHDPTAIYRFEEHDIFLPMVVLEELDAGKKGRTEVARNVRQTNRLLDELVNDKSYEEIAQGIEIPNLFKDSNNTNAPSGRLFFQTQEIKSTLTPTLPGNKPDNTILSTTLSLQKHYTNKIIILISKDINLRVKAGLLGIHAEDYSNDKVLDDVALLHTGCIAMPRDFWNTHSKDMESWHEEGRTFYRVQGPEVKHWFPNDFIYSDDEENFSATVHAVDEHGATIGLIADYSNPKNAIWGITARNREQNFAFNLLMNPDIDFVSLQGTAGSGKTLLALAAGLVQTIDKNQYSEIIVTRVTVPLGEDIGFLPGTEEEKMTPWMGALMDNLEVLNKTESSETTDEDWQRAATNDLLCNRVKVRSLNFMRGRTFLNKYIIIDEAQNLTSKQIKTLITRAGPNTKIVCLGDIRQIDTPYLTETTSGLTYVIDQLKTWKHSGHVTLVRGERSRLSVFAAENL